MSQDRRVAVVLFNLGGPDGPDAVQPFLRNLFSDPAIIRQPAPVRFFLSRLISSSRAASARENYAKMGGGSPLLPETMKQAMALDMELAKRASSSKQGWDAKSFIAMRYWKPFAADAASPCRLSRSPSKITETSRPRAANSAVGLGSFTRPSHPSSDPSVSIEIAGRHIGQQRIKSRRS